MIKNCSLTRYSQLTISLFATFATDEVSKIFIPILYKIRNKYKPLYDAFVGYLNLHNESNHNNYSSCCYFFYITDSINMVFYT